MTVRPYVAADGPAVVDVLTRAFADHPAYRFSFPRASGRDRHLRAHFARRVRAEAAHLWVSPVDGRIVGAATRGVPAAAGAYDALVAWALPTLLGPGPIALRRAFLAGQAFGRALSPWPGADYVDLVAIHPDAQGQGHGHALLTGVLAAPGPVVLLTQVERTLALYAGFGLEVRGRFEVRDGDAVLTSWVMAR